MGSIFFSNCFRSAWACSLGLFCFFAFLHLICPVSMSKRGVVSSKALSCLAISCFEAASETRPLSFTLDSNKNKNHFTKLYLNLHSFVSELNGQPSIGYHLANSRVNHPYHEPDKKHNQVSELSVRVPFIESSMTSFRTLNMRAFGTSGAWGCAVPF